jgi:hypothetical protein
LLENVDDPRHVRNRAFGPAFSASLGDGFAEMLRSHCAGLGEPVPFDVEAYARSLDFPDGQTGLRLALTGLEAAPTRRRS